MSKPSGPASSTVETVVASGSDGRRSMITGSATPCAAIFPYVALPPLFLAVRIVAIPLRSRSARSSASSKGPRAVRYAACGRASGGSTGSTLRTR